MFLFRCDLNSARISEVYCFLAILGKISHAAHLRDDKFLTYYLYRVFQTFCVVSKRFRKNYIHRFTATSSWFIFSPWNPIRRYCIFLSTNQYFDYMVMATIILNCAFLAMTETIEEAE